MGRRKNIPERENQREKPSKGRESATFKQLKAQSGLGVVRVDEAREVSQAL